MLLNPGYALLTGVIAGIVATYGFSFLTPALKSRGLTDTCGIVNLHLIPGIIGGVCGAIAATTVQGDKWPDAAIAVAFPGRIVDGVPREAGVQVWGTRVDAYCFACDCHLCPCLLQRVACAPLQAALALASSTSACKQH